MEQITNEEILKIISKQWCSTEDIKKLAGVGKLQARRIKNRITEELKSMGYSVPTYKVPTSFVVKKLCIDKKYLDLFTEKSQD